MTILWDFCQGCKYRLQLGCPEAGWGPAPASQNPWCLARIPTQPQCSRLPVMVLLNICGMILWKPSGARKVLGTWKSLECRSRGCAVAVGGVAVGRGCAGALAVWSCFICFPRKFNFFLKLILSKRVCVCKRWCPQRPWVLWAGVISSVSYPSKLILQNSSTCS